jgi:sporulation protein YlmC with PRC-barrel domain
MKLKLGLLTTAAATSFVALPILDAAEERDTNHSVTPSYERARARGPERLGKVAKASEVIGMDIRNRVNEKLGEVEDLAVDLEAGRIVHVILDGEEKTVAVPPRIFTCDESAKALRLDMDQEKLAAAPAFESTDWNGRYDTNRVAESYRYYGQEPYFGERSGSPKAAASTRMGHVEKASKIIGKSVKNRQDEKLGEVEDLIVDFAAGRIVQVIVSSGGFLGIGAALSAVPPTAFQYDSTRDILHLDATKETLAKAPHFKSTEWPEFSDPAYVSGVYRAYQVEPYFDTNAFDVDNTKQNVRERHDASVTPLDQGSSERDLDITRRIRKEILDQEDISVNARNIKVITANGRVTLRGPVNSSDEKRLLGEIAGRIAQADNVDNQLEVKGAVKE